MFKRISEKWAVRVLLTLQMTPMHFLALQRSQPGVSKKVLSERLRHLERDGLVIRRPEIHQSSVDYSLTAVGQSLCIALEPLHQWAEEHSAAVEKARRRFDATHREGAGSSRAPASDALSTSSHQRTAPLNPRSSRPSANRHRSLVSQ
jgi:DNA-binding HxlR family transcriptional regulator